MSDFLTRLAQRQLGELATIEPRVASLYAPTAKQFGLQSIAEETEPQPTSHAPAVAAGIPPSHSHEISKANDQPPKDSLYSHEPVPAESQLNQDRLFKTEVRRLIPSNTLYTNDLSQRQSELGESEPSPNKKPLFRTTTNVTPVAPLPLVVNSINSVPFTERQSQLIAPAALGPRDDQRHNPAQQSEEAPVHVTIGRIEVTAVTTAAAPRRPPASRRQGMSLDEYLSRRQRREK